jgi:hypothetical protein
MSLAWADVLIMLSAYASNDFKSPLLSFDSKKGTAHRSRDTLANMMNLDSQSELENARIYILGEFGEERNSNYIPFHRKSASGLKVVVATPLDERGRCGIDRMMDAIRCQFREYPRANVDFQFLISRGANIFLSPIVLVWALLTIIFMRARQGIDLPFPSKLGR